MNKESYTAASTFPVKLLHTKVLDARKIMPVHIQLSPTNACNLSCKFCSCSDRDKKKQLSLEEIKWVLDVCAERGAKAMTITGGGEPLLHPQINEILRYADKKKIEVGLVTNGILFKRLEYHKNLVWCRISSADDRTPDYDSIEYGISINPQVDWAFSHVVTKNPNYIIIQDLIDFATKHKFTHVRLVSDLLDLKDVPSMKFIKKHLKNDGRVIYQGRKDSTRGVTKCYISLLKPVICPEGIFPCCGAQYAFKGQSRDMVDRMKMGDIKDLPEILDEQINFDGLFCDVCYYQQYNQILSLLKEGDVKHVNFV